MHEESDFESESAPVYFAHETLKVYQTGLALCKEIERIVPTGKNIRDRYVRRIDEASTSLVLNVAEGNGRYSTDQHRYFMDMAEEAGSKLAEYLDLFAVTSDVDVTPAKVLLRLAMLKIAGMKGYLTNDVER
jgi:four helix bundle protein